MILLWKGIENETKFLFNMKRCKMVKGFLCVSMDKLIGFEKESIQCSKSGELTEAILD